MKVEEARRQMLKDEKIKLLHEILDERIAILMTGDTTKDLMFICWMLDSGNYNPEVALKEFRQVCHECVGWKLKFYKENEIPYRLNK